MKHTNQYKSSKKKNQKAACTRRHHATTGGKARIAPKSYLNFSRREVRRWLQNKSKLTGRPSKNPHGTQMSSNSRPRNNTADKSGYPKRLNSLLFLVLYSLFVCMHSCIPWMARPSSRALSTLVCIDSNSMYISSCCIDQPYVYSRCKAEQSNFSRAEALTNAPRRLPTTAGANQD